jgi:hypothetical protein
MRRAMLLLGILTRARQMSVFLHSLSCVARSIIEWGGIEDEFKLECVAKAFTWGDSADGHAASGP